MDIRLDKYISDFTELTRSEAKKAIRDGRVRVNGETARKPNAKLSFSDSVFMGEEEVGGGG